MILELTFLICCKIKLITYEILTDISSVRGHQLLLVLTPISYAVGYSVSKEEHW